MHITEPIKGHPRVNLLVSHGPGMYHGEASNPRGESVLSGTEGAPERRGRRKSFVQFLTNLRHGPIGLVRTYQTELSFRVEVWAIPVIAVLLVWRHCSISRWFVVFSWVAIVLIAELVNTTIENGLRAWHLESEQELLDKDSPRHRVVKRSYDQAAGAVTIALLMALIVVVWAMIWPG